MSFSRYGGGLSLPMDPNIVVRMRAAELLGAAAAAAGSIVCTVVHTFDSDEPYAASAPAGGATITQPRPGLARLSTSAAAGASINFLLGQTTLGGTYPAIMEAGSSAVWHIYTRMMMPAATVTPAFDAGTYMVYAATSASTMALGCSGSKTLQLVCSAGSLSSGVSVDTLGDQWFELEAWRVGGMTSIAINRAVLGQSAGAYPSSVARGPAVYASNGALTVDRVVNFSEIAYSYLRAT